MGFLEKFLQSILRALVGPSAEERIQEAREEPRFRRKYLSALRYNRDLGIVTFEDSSTDRADELRAELEETQVSGISDNDPFLDSFGYSDDFEQPGITDPIWPDMEIVNL